MKKMNHCLICEYNNKCEYTEWINFCEDCKDFEECRIKTVFCQAGHEIECNNGFEQKSDYWLEDDEEEG